MYTYRLRESRRKKLLPFIFVVFILACAGLVFLLSSKDKQTDVPVQQQQASTAAEEVRSEPQEKSFDQVALQTLLTDWESTHAGQYSVVLADKNGKTLAAINPDEVYYAASIYKLFVVYEAYQRVDSGEYNLDATYAAGLSLRECLDQIIRLSNTNEAQNCSETLWAKQGKEAATKKLENDYGLKNTSLVGLYTSAGDTAIILSRLESAKDLSQSSQGLFLESMKNQIHRKGLPAGITTATVYEKVGFNEDLEYHDAAILRFPDGRSLIVSLFTKSAGTKNVSGLASAIEKSVLQTQ
jgi:hypothetical protein